MNSGGNRRLFVAGSRCYREFMIAVAGSVNMDLVARVPRIAAPGQTVLGHGFAQFHGGKGANQAVAAARLGANVQFFGAVGRDAFGDALQLGLRDEGIATKGLGRVDAPSGCALISVSDDGENAIAVLPGANALAPLPPHDWPGDVASDVVSSASISWLLLQLEVPLATCLAWAQAASARGVRVMLNAAPMMALPASLLECVDTLVVNEGELAALVGAVADIDTALAAAAGLGPQRVVVTLGAAGCRAVDADSLLHVAGTKVEVVDTTGAGDTFVGALAAGLDAGLTFDLALQRANVAAALSCAVVGARGGMPDGVALMKAMKAMDAMR